MAGYSDKPLVSKLGIKPGAKVLLVRPPRGFRSTLGPLPSGARELAQRKGPFDVIHLFVKSADVLPGIIRSLRRSLATNGMLWVSWPKRASGVATDVDENVVRHAGLSLGLVDVKVCAVDETWSGLKFVIPIKLRTARE